MKIIVRRTAGIGDSLAATVVADLLHELGHEVTWQTHPEIIPIIKRHTTIVRVEAPRGHCDVNLDGCYENSVISRITHFHDQFITAASLQLERVGVHLKINKPPKPPQLNRDPKSGISMQMRLGRYDRPWISVIPRSYFQTRCVPDSIWHEACALFEGNVFWLGEHPRVKSALSHQCHSISEVADYILVSDLVVTVDTGPMHIASAYGVPMVVISQSHDVHLRLSPLSDFEVVKRGDLSCLNCQRHRCPIDPYNPPCGQIDPKELADAVNRKLAQLEPSNPIAA